MSSLDRNSRDDEDAAVVLTIVAALAASAAPPEGVTSPGALSVWGDPGHRLVGRPAPSAAAWWASGLPR